VDRAVPHVSIGQEPPFAAVAMGAVIATAVSAVATRPVTVTSAVVRLCLITQPFREDASAESSQPGTSVGKSVNVLMVVWRTMRPPT
jgi:hypothetical protein